MGALHPHGPVLADLEEGHPLEDLDRLQTRMLAVVVEVDLAVGKRQIHMLLVDVLLLLRSVVEVGKRPDGLVEEGWEERHLRTEEVVMVEKRRVGVPPPGLGVGHLVGLEELLEEGDVRRTHMVHLHRWTLHQVDNRIVRLRLNLNLRLECPLDQSTHTELLHLSLMADQHPTLHLHPGVHLLPPSVHPLHPESLLPQVLSGVQHPTAPQHHTEPPLLPSVPFLPDLPTYQTQTDYHTTGQWISGISSLKSDLLLNPIQKHPGIIREEHTTDVGSDSKITWMTIYLKYALSMIRV